MIESIEVRKEEIEKAIKFIEEQRDTHYRQAYNEISFGEVSQMIFSGVYKKAEKFSKIVKILETYQNSLTAPADLNDVD